MGRARGATTMRFTGFCAVVLMAAVCSAWDDPPMHDMANLDAYNTLVGEHSTRENGFCVHSCSGADTSGETSRSVPWIPRHQRGFDPSRCTDQNSGVVKVNSNDGNSDSAQLACLEACRARSDATGCEVIWSQGNRGCYIHTQTVQVGNLVGNHYCWVFGDSSRL